jgi:spore coat polysaccharide biosynthesis protein SpsF
MGSTRLPGKVMLSLDGSSVLTHVIRRARAADAVDRVVVATTFHPPDDIVARYAEREGAGVFRGSEDDVLGRLRRAAKEYDAEIVVRLTADNPFVEPKLISAIIRRVRSGVDYASNKVERTWPIGVDAEAFTPNSFDQVATEGREAHHREHVTPYYHENPDIFDLQNVTVEDVYGERPFEAGPELRLTLDEVSDYELYRHVYEAIEFCEIIDVRDAVRYIVENDLGSMNTDVQQKTLW